jgi:hypothetical protein
VPDTSTRERFRPEHDHGKTSWVPFIRQLLHEEGPQLSDDRIAPLCRIAGTGLSLAWDDRDEGAKLYRPPIYSGPMARLREQSVFGESRINRNLTRCEKRSFTAAWVASWVSLLQGNAPVCWLQTSDLLAKADRYLQGKN